MTEAFLFTLAGQTIMLVLKVAGPVLLFSLVVGVAVSIFQAITQIQDMTLTFVPKIIAVIAAMLLFGPWTFRTMIEFTYRLFMMLPEMVR